MTTTSPRADHSSARPVVRLLRATLAMAMGFLTVPFLTLAPAYADDAATTPTSVVSTEVVDPPPDPASDQPPADTSAAQEPAPDPAAQEAPAPESPAPDTTPPATDPAPDTTAPDTNGGGSSGGPKTTLKAAPQLDPLPAPDCSVTDFTQNTKEDASGTWINGALNDTKSDYAEGDFVPQKIDLGGLVPGNYTIGFTFDRTKNGKYAYDYVDHLAIQGSAGASVSWSSSTDPADFDGPAPTNSPGATYTVSVTIAFTITDASDPTAVLRWDGHVASELDYGPNSGAGSISGAPYHFSLVSTGGAFGCDGGSRDNQLMASAVDAGLITIVKDAQPDAAQDFHFGITAPNNLDATFDLDDDGGSDSTLSNTITYRVPPGTTTVSELNIPDGWTLTDISCDAAAQKTATSASVALVDDQHVTCTFTNSRTSSIEVDKYWVINGGTPVQEGSEPANLGLGAQLTVDGTNKPWDTVLGGYLHGTSVSLNESVTFGNDLCDWAGTTHGHVTEVNGTTTDAALPDSVALAGGANHATITNEVTCAGELILKKVVDNSNGGTAVPGDFTLVASPAGGGADLTTPGSTAGHSFNVTAGASYDLSETGGPSGYDLSGIDCGAGPVTSVQVPAGDSRTCTFTNHDNPGSLTLVKVVDHNGTGDTTPATAWTLTATPDGIAGQSTISGTTGVSGATKAGAYDLSESGPTTHTAGTWSCSDSGGAVAVTAGEVTVPPDDDVTCTITNTAIAPQLTLVKIVDPGDTGDLTQPSAFTLTATPDGIAGQDPVSGPGPQVDATVKVGTYDLSESGPVGYDPSEAGWSCTDQNQDPVTVTADAVTLALAQHVTCTITNVAVPATVEVDKYWVVNGGEPMIDGTQPAHLQLGAQLTVNGDNQDWNTVIGGFLRGAPVSVDEDVTIGNRLCRETGASVVEINGSSANEDLPFGTTVLGGTNHYTVTNEVTCDAGLTLVKVVDNGDASASAWSLSATRVDGSSLAFSSGNTPVAGTVTADAAYTLSENDADSRYVQVGPWDCTQYASLAGDDVSVAAGRTATCTVHNATGELTLVKVVENPNGGTAVAGDFTLHATGPDSGDHAVAGSAGTTIYVDPEETFALSETGGPTGYDLDSLTCGGDPATSVQVPAGEHVTCTFTNSDSPGRLILDKIVDHNSTGDTTAASAWHLSGTPQGIDGQSTVQGDGHADGAVKAGTYALDEDGPSNHTSGTWSCTGPDGSVPVSESGTVELAAIETVHCQITNTAIQPTLTLVKVVDPGNTGDETPASAFTVTATPDGIAGQAPVTGAGTATSIVKVGDYALSEDGPTTYMEDEAGWSCVDGSDDAVAVTAGEVSVGLAQDITCTIVNHAIPSEWMVSKTSDPESGATVAPGEQIDYDVTLTKVGNGVPVEDFNVTDTLTGVEDSWVSGLADDGASISGGVITWHIDELGDTPLHLTYTVTVGENAWNSEIDNVVTPGPVPCEETMGADCGHTEHFTPHYTLDKAVQLLATPGDGDNLAEPGEHLKYTLTVHNDTKHALVDTVITDDATSVFANATLVSKDAALDFDGSTFTWTITGLEPGATTEVSYVVEINAGAWGVSLHNVSTPVPDEGGECVPPGDVPGGIDDNSECETTTDTPQVTTMVVEKRDLESDEVLPDATFQLYDAGAIPEGGCQFGDPVAVPSEDKLLGTATTSELGQALFHDLQHGCYVLVETSAPPNYDLPDHPVMGIQVDESNFVAGGDMTPIVVTDFAEGQLAIVAKQQFEFHNGAWEPSDGVVDFGDTVRYVVRVSATGPKNFHDVRVTDYVPGYNPEDTTSTVKGTLVPDSATCEDGLTCTVSVDPVTQLVTFDVGDLTPGNGVTEGGAAVMEVQFPEEPADLNLQPGDTYTATLWNQGFLDWNEAIEQTAPTFGRPAGGAAAGRLSSLAAVALETQPHHLVSNEVVVRASVTAPPEKTHHEPGKVPHKGELPQTGAPAGLGPIAAISGLLLALGLRLGLSRRKE
ncbi:prealbumin-like fold domain-containing protein [Nocardioides jejuensis]|uniref:Gram-positive cocci surface proteins LPxTG domain-containing protein n=1 Tax=Nocardioides jejuensis TaxID=2502782 RepID=A0A4R1CEY8_9ACTN|nr:SpaA isopeptide-forming pilin-related protein [Nocardioides jejuensis]TCJ29844.1 hypothetical protein EPD65_05945 [Nocardioides jejuensis]